MSHHDVAAPAGSRLSENADRVSQPATQQIAPAPAAGAFDWREWLWGFIQRMLVMLTIYVLSIGPLYWQWYGARFAGGSTLLAAFYEPLVIIAQWIPPFGEWMDWYVGLWIG